MIVLGRITAPYGVQGWVRVHPFGDDPLAWRSMPLWWLGADPDAQEASAWRAVKLKACRMHGKGFVAAFDEITERVAVEALEGLYIAAPREALPKPGLDEFYWADLIGLAVINKADVLLGSVSALIDTGAHDVLTVVDGETERLIPFVAAYVGEVDLVKKTIQVDWELDW